MKTVLVPTDFSEQATYALQLAAQIVRKSGGSLKALHVIEYPGAGSFNTMGEVATADADNVFVVQMLEAAKDKMREMPDDPAFQGITLETYIQVGNPYRSIASYVSDNEVDLVVMGTKGSSGIEEVLIGSNTEKVVRHSKCPVITVKQPIELGSIKNIAYATSLSNDEKHVVARLRQLQELTGAKLHLVKVNTPNSFESDRFVKSRMKKFAEEHGLTDITMNVYNDSVEEDGIIYFAEDFGADLIAMSTHGRTGLMHLLSGSVAEDVVNHAKRPVWTCRLK